MKMYMILNKATCFPISKAGRLRMAVKENEVSHSERGEIMMTDVLKKMGYQMEGTFGGEMYAILPKEGPMTKEKRYNIDDLTLISIDSETGIIC